MIKFMQLLLLLLCGQMHKNNCPRFFCFSSMQLPVELMSWMPVIPSKLIYMVIGYWKKHEKEQWNDSDKRELRG